MKKDIQLAYFVLRIATGIDLFGHGFIRLAGNVEAFHGWLLKTFAGSLMPEILVNITGYLIPPAELLLGVLLLLGFKTRETLLVASAMMMCLIAGSCLIQNWEIVGMQLFYIVVYAILIALRSYNFLSADNRLKSTN